MKVLITGATGLLGSELIKSMQSNLDLVTAGKSRPRDSHSEHCFVDFAGNWKFTDLPASVDVIIHLAQSENYGKFPEFAEDVFKVNVASTSRLAAYALEAGATRFMFASTGGLYRPKKLKVNEKSPLLDFTKMNNYFASKLTSEILLEQYSSYFDLNVLRIFYMYGPIQKRDRFLRGLYEKVLNGEPIYISGKNGGKINPIHANDVARYIFKSLDIPAPRLVNIAGSETITVLDIVKRFELSTEKTANINFTPPTSTLRSSIKTMSNVLSKPSYSLSEGIDECVNIWEKQN